MSPGLKALGELPLAAWVQILAVIGVIELTVGKQDYENKVGLLSSGRVETRLNQTDMRENCKRENDWVEYRKLSSQQSHHGQYVDHVLPSIGNEMTGTP